MRTIWGICQFELKRTFKSKSSYVIMFLMPLLFTFIFGGMFGSENGKMKILYVDQDRTTVSKSYYSILHAKNSLYQVDQAEQKEAEKRLKAKEISGIVMIQEGFEEGLLNEKKSYLILKFNPDFTSSGAVEQFLSENLSKIRTNLAGAQVWSTYSNQPWETLYKQLIEESELTKASVIIEPLSNNNNQKNGNASTTSAGFTILFVMIMMMYATGVFLEARQNGTWQRLLTTPVNKYEILFGYLLSFFVIGWIQFGVLMIGTYLLFGVIWGSILGNILLVSTLLLAVIGLGLFIAGTVKTIEQQSAIGTLVVISTCMMSGVYWPLELEPDFMQKLAHFFPQTWAIKGFNELMILGNDWMSVLTYCGILLLFAAVFLGFGITRIKYE